MRKVTLLIALFVMMSVACAEEQPEPTATPQSTNTPRPTTTFTPTPTLTPSPTATPTITPTPLPLTPSEVFDHVSPSIVYVELPNKSGSGVLIEGGYIVTNAHVVWPHTHARVVFPDETEFLEVPIMNLDLMADLAVLGPIDLEEIDAEAQPMVDGEELVIGSDVFLIGYPGEVDEFPTPTITRGLISRVREWDFLGITYFQTDATIAGGQSGGVLVSDRGDVIGISGLRFTEAGFGIIASAKDIGPRIEGLVAGEDVDGLGDRRVPTEGGRDHHTVILDNEYQTGVFVINEPVGTEVTIELFGGGEGGFRLYDPNGFPLLFADSNITGRLEATGEIESEGPHFLEIYQHDFGRTTFTVAASHDIFPYDSPEEDELAFVTSPLSIGAKTERQGSIDYPGDTDTFEINLNAGDEVTIRVDSILIDPYIEVSSAAASFNEVISDDDSGGGIFSLSPELTFRAPHTGDFLITVEDFSFFGGQGGYVLTVQAPFEGAPTPIAIAPTAVPQDSPFGPMALYESEENLFSMQYPADWNENNEPSQSLYGAQCALVFDCVHSPEGDTLLFFELDLTVFGTEDLTLEDFIQLAQDDAAAQGNTFISQEAFTTEQGLEGYILKSRNEILRGILKVEFAYVHDGYLFDVVYAIPEDDVEEYEEMIRYTFGTVAIIEE